MKVFRKQKMLDRLKKEGRLNEVTEEAKSMMGKLDGLEAHPNRWRQTVHMEENAYYVCINDEQVPVNGLDCEDV